MGFPSKRPVHEELFLRSRLISALRTGWACLMAGLLVQLGNLHVQWMAFPIFSYVMAITVVGESTLGRAIQDFYAVIIGSFQGVGMGMLALQLLDVQKITLGVSILCTSLCSFIIVYPTNTHVLSKRVALAQTAIINIYAFIQKENIDTVYFPLRLGGTTVVGATCGMLALVFPFPRLAFSEVHTQARLASWITSERLRVMVDAFSINHETKSTSLNLQARSLAKIEADAHSDITAKEGDVQWELPKYRVTAPNLECLTKGLDRLRKQLLGMDMALQSKLNSPSRTSLDEVLKDCLMYLTDWSCLALRHACARDLGSSVGHSLSQIIIEEGIEALMTFDDALIAVRQKLKCTTDREIDSKMVDVLEDLLVGSGLFGRMPVKVDVEVSFQSKLAIFFFLFTIKRFVEETEVILSTLQTKPHTKLKQLGTLGQNPENLEKRTGKQVAIQPCDVLSAHNNDSQTNDCASFSGLRAQSDGLCSNCCRTQIHQHQQNKQNNTKPGNRWIKLARLFRFKPNDEQLRTSIKMSLAMALAAFFGTLFNQSHGYWAPITVGLGFGNTKGSSFKISNLRAQGTVAGTVYGLLVALATVHVPYLRLVALIPWAIFTSFLRQSKLYGFSGSLSAFSSAIVVLCRSQMGSSDQEFTVIRIVEAFLGMASFIIVEMIILPRRAASLVRKEVVAGSKSLGDYLAAVLSAYSGQQCLKCCNSVIEDLKNKEKNLRTLIARQNGLVKEAMDEPAFWFSPFPGSNYSKVVGVQGRMLDLLQFALSSLEATMAILQNDPASVGKLHQPLGPALHNIEEEVLPTVEFLGKMLQMSFGEKVLQSNTSSSAPLIHEFDLENQAEKTANEKKLPNIAASVQSERTVHAVSHYSCTSDIEPPDRHQKFLDAFEKGFKQVTKELPQVSGDNHGQRSVEAMNNTIILCLSALGFILDGVLKQTSELEKAVKELLQAENPWSLIELHLPQSYISEMSKNSTR